jgi:hypothetical protein
MAFSADSEKVSVNWPKLRAVESCANTRQAKKIAARLAAAEAGGCVLDLDTFLGGEISFKVKSGLNYLELP